MRKGAKSFSIEVGGKTLTLEVSSLAERANAAVLAKYGETVVLVTAVMSPHESSVGYLPLKVDYEERFYAAGKIIGSRFIRREGRPSEEAILTGRLIDRVIRPLFNHRLRHDVQVVLTVLAFDGENDPDFVGLLAASAALGISDIPWNGPAAAVRIAKIGGHFVVNPGNTDMKNGEANFETFTAGTESVINMIEFGGNESTEADALEAFTLAQKEITRLVAFVRDIIKEIGHPKANAKLVTYDPRLEVAVKEFMQPRIEAVLYRPALEYYRAMGEFLRELLVAMKEKFESEGLYDVKAVELIMDDEIDRIVHENILLRERRPDDRGINEIRALSAETGLFERTHGSAFFVRGNTQALAVVTLASPGAEQLIETMEMTGKRRFMLHYNFPPYSVGEIGNFRGPGRREIGHGALAEKALRPMIPTQETFPYTIRIVSETLSSNGSSSMATVCASTLALLDAGVPLKKPVAGIAMGLMTDDAGNYKILTDLQGAEDHHGDMDFKVAGTADGVTAIQLDVKIKGLTPDMIKATLAQAREARLAILKVITDTISLPRSTLSKYVPAIAVLKINPDKIGLVIGPGGKMINGLIKKYALETIDIDDDGTVFVSGDTREKVDRASNEIKGLTREFTIGEIIEGPIIKILEFGAIVDLGGGKDGMIHVSELKNGFVKNPADVVKVGDVVRAKVIRADEDGRIGLSLKQM